jgi:hypothetical protein
MKNLDDFFGDDESKNVAILVTVTKKFFGFVSQLAEIVYELQESFIELSDKVDQLTQERGSGMVSAPPITTSTPRAPPVAPSTPRAPPVAPSAPSAPPPIPSAPSAPAVATSAPSSPPGFPAPPSPTTASSSGLPPLPGLSPTPQPSFGVPSKASLEAGFQGLTPVPAQAQAQAQAPKPRASPMNLKAQMNNELKEAFARIKKGWAEDE